MFRSTIAASLFLSLAFSAIAAADASVWFEYKGGGGAFLLAPQGEGRVLEIGTADIGPFDLEISMYATVTGVGLYSANTTLAADTNASIPTMTMIPPDLGAETPAGGLNTPGPGDIATGFGGATFLGDGYLGEDILLGTFTLHAVRDLNLLTVITARVGNGVWAQSDTQGAPLRFADGGFQNGGVAGNALTDVIKVHYGVPEPTTFGLIALGAMFVLTRRHRGLDGEADTGTK